MMDYLEEDLYILSDYLSDFSGSTILVTGATGLIGSIVIKALQRCRKISIIGLARSSQKVESIFPNKDNITFLYQDISAPITTRIKCDYIIHTATPTVSKYFMSNPVEVMDNIYSGTKQMLEYAKINSVKGMVYLSSMEAFGVVKDDKRLEESELGYIDIQNIRSCYSEGKRHAELLCKCYAVEYGVNVCIARLSQTFGAGIMPTENRVFAQFARSALRGEDIVLHTKGQSVGNYCYTRDAVKALFLLLKKGEKGQVYTVVNEETTRTIAELAEMVANILSGHRSKVVFDIPEGNQYGYAPETKLRLSGEKLRALGWKPEVGLEDMFRRMAPYL